MSGGAGGGRRSGGPGLLAAAPYLLSVLWLEAGYAAALRLVAGLPTRVALWQGAICVAAIVPLLACVLLALALPKRLRWRARAVVWALWVFGSLAQFALPWAGWVIIVRLMNLGAISWPAALRAGSAIALFSFLSGLALLLVFRPRPGDVVVTRLDVPVPGLPEAFDGYRIVHLADLHVGLLLSAEGARRRLAAAEGVEADLMVFTGDLASGKPECVRQGARMLADLRGEDGAAAVLGNHDNWMGARAVRSALSEHGVPVLLNEHTTLARDGAKLHLAGVDDASYTRRADLPAALAGIPEGAPVILLSHAPDIIDNPLVRRTRLVLSGHTHGGQVVLPWIGPVYVPSRVGRRYASGLHEMGGFRLFVSRGIGEVFPPLRIGCPPEIAVLTLRRGDQH